jgi:hypothetical protein
MSADDDQTMCAPDDSETGVVVADDTMAGTEAAEGETAIIAPADAVNELRQLAWSTEEPETDDFNDIEVHRRSWLQTAVIGVGILAAGLVVADGVGLLHHADHATTTTATPWTTDVLATPTYTPPLADTAPPVTLVPPPVTVMAIPSTMTQTIAPNPRAVFPTPAPRTGVAAFTKGIEQAPASEPMPPISAALIDGYEVCNRMSAGQSRRDIENTLAAEHGMDFGSAVWIWIQATRKLCPA